MCMFKTEGKDIRGKEEGKSNCKCLSEVQAQHGDGQGREQTNQGLVHLKCQMLNKNKLEGRTPITTD